MIPLRPNYTLFLLKELQKKSINAYGNREQGQWRLLQDIKVLARAQGNIVFLLDMKLYVDNYKGFIKEIRKQLYSYLPDAKEESMDGLAHIVIAIDELTVNRHIIFLFHDFDALFDNPLVDKHYDNEFFDTINTLTARGERFIATTVLPHSYSKIHITHKTQQYEQEKKEQKLSWLVCEEVVLPDLTTKEINDELVQHNLTLSSKQIAFLILLVRQHSRPYLLLEFLITKLRLNDPVKVKFRQRVKKWRDLFDTLEKIPWYKRQYYVKEILRSLQFKLKNLFKRIANKFKKSSAIV
ncbi:MAG: hypothetical protein WAX77_08675 [Methylococcaceae bacterium]